VTDIYLELGKRRVFAAAVEWPGWCRAGSHEGQAIDALAAAADRYAVVARRAGVPFGPPDAQDFEVIERLPGSASTDFGVPGAAPACDAEPGLDARGAKRIAALVAATWLVFDDVVAAAPLELRKGPRGGGRNRDKIVEHVLNAEVAYARKLGLREPPLQTSDAAAVGAFRATLAETLEAAIKQRGSPGPSTVPGAWLPRYAARRIAWHVLDHAWEIEDKIP